MLNKQITRNYHTILSTVLLTVLSCVMRDDDSQTRDNPFDAGGSNWTVNAPPEVSLTVEPLWADYNHADSTGSKRITIAISDRNFPYDTVTLAPVINGQRILQLHTAAPVETTLLVDNLQPSKRYPCSMGTSDTRGVFTAAPCTLSTSSDIPPQPPRPTITSGAGSISITWEPVPGAATYSVYSAAGKYGPYTLKRTISQPESGPIIVLDTPTYTPRYYRFASNGSAGASFLRDTLLGRVYYSGLATPYFSSVSKGIYKDYISLSYYGSSNRAEIYRSIRDTLSFELIDTFPTVSSSYTTRYFFDSIATGDTCYYRMYIVDQQGRCSRPSPIEFGYLQRTAAPTGMTLTAYNDYLRVSWSSSSAASYWRIYRSNLSCIENMVLIDSVYTFNYQDTTPDARVYYYTIRGVDASGRESAPGTCVSGRISILPAPINFKASEGLYLHRISLSWSPVEGASGYIITRGVNTDTAWSTILDTVSTTTYDDPVASAAYLYYRVAAFNARGTGLYSIWASGWLSAVPVLYGANNAGFVRLSWSTQPGAIRYYLYRSTDSTNFYPLGSTTATYYNDTLADFSRHYYRMALLTPDGMSLPGRIVGGQRLPLPPSGLNATTSSNTTILKWGSVPGATQYRLYRSATGSGFTLYTTLTDTVYYEPATSLLQYYYVTTVVSGIESGSSASVKVTGTSYSTVPPAPYSVSVIGNAFSIVLYWSTNSPIVPINGFYLYRSNSQNGPFSCIDTVTSSSYYDSVPDSLQHYYKIAAFNNVGTGPSTGIYSGKRTALPLVPAALINVRINGKIDYIEISWNISAASPPANGYSIYRSTSASGTFVRIYTVQSLVYYDTVYDTSVYYYKLDAFNSEGSSPPTAVYSGRCASLSHAPPAPRDLIASQGSQTGVVALAWSASSGALGYRVYRAPTDTFDRDIVFRKEVTTTSCFDSAGSDSMYFYRVRAFNAGGEGKYSDTNAIGFRTPSTVPHAPVNSYTSGQYDGIYIGWENPSTAIGITGFAIYRSQSLNGPFVRITTRKTIGYNDIPPAIETKYWYYITAENQKGESTPSGTVSGMIPKNPY